MGIHEDDIRFVEDVIGKNWSAVHMAMLGNQRIRVSDTPFAMFAAARDARCIGFDLNGLDGCLAVDLDQPLSGYDEAFDCILNFGTSEHCMGQETVFRNIHTMCRPGGFMIHHVPLAGHWPGHSPFKYAPGFFSTLSVINGYKVALLEEVRRGSDRLATRCAIRRGNESFSGIPGEYLVRCSDWRINSDNLKHGS
jgi:SAM-dependent methyltransferase